MDNTFPNKGEHVDELVAINKQIYEKNAQLLTHNRILSTLKGIYDVINNSLGIEQTSIGLIDEMVKQLDLDLGIIFLVDGTRTQLRPSAFGLTPILQSHLPEISQLLKNTKVEISNSSNLLAKAIFERKPFITEGTQALFTSEVNKDLNTYLENILHLGSSVVYPFKFAEKVLGVVLLSYVNQSKKLSDSNHEILNEIIDVIGIGIQNSLLYTQTRDQVIELQIKNQELNTIAKITNQIVSTLDPKEVAQRAADLIPGEMGYFGGIINAFDPIDRELVVIAVTKTNLDDQIRRLLDRDYLEFKYKIDDVIVKNQTSVNAINLGQFVTGTNFIDELSPPLDNDIAVKINSLIKPKCIVSHPIKSRNQIIGVVTFVITHKTVNELTKEDFDLMQTFAYQTGIGLENARLYFEANKLTSSLAEKNKQLEEYAQKERDILDIMGHELRTPITIVRNSISLLSSMTKSDVIDKEKLSHYVEVALRSTQREINIIETMLASTKVDAKKVQLSRISVNPSEVIEEAIEGQKENAKMKNLKLSVNIPEHISQIYADRSRLQEVMDNFLSNAVKYTNAGSVEIDVSEDENFVIFKIKDTGIGIPADEISKLGTKFYRVGQHIQEESQNYNVVRPGGTGLGLYVTFSLVELHGGSVKVESNFGSGSTFIFTIPKYTGQTIETNASASKDLLERYRRKKIRGDLTDQ